MLDLITFSIKEISQSHLQNKQRVKILKVNDSNLSELTEEITTETLIKSTRVCSNSIMN